MKTKTCKICKQTKPIIRTITHKRTGKITEVPQFVGKNHYCKACNEYAKLTNEHTLQVEFFELLELNFPEIRLTTFAIPNGGLRNARVAEKLTKEGLTKGVWDIFVSRPSYDGEYHGMYIDFKTYRGKLSEYQEDFREHVGDNYYFLEIIHPKIAIQEVVKFVTGREVKI